MGAGRRTESYTGTHPPTLISDSADVGARFLCLSPSNLGGVIFGCTHETIKECFETLLFGLPYRHFTYIRNIKPGLPLFLFNYNGRKLHGVFEAASCGELEINPHAWTSNTKSTPYPAQVRVRVKTSCPPLSESIYKKAIIANYHSEIHFSNELDKTQARLLMTLFTSKESRIPSAVTRTMLSLQAVQQEEEGDDDGWIKPRKTLKSKRNVCHETIRHGQDESLQERFIVSEDAAKTDTNCQRNSWHMPCTQGEDESLEKRCIASEDAVKTDTNYAWHMPCMQGVDESSEERPKLNAWEEALHQGHDEYLEKSKRSAWCETLQPGQDKSLEERCLISEDAKKGDRNSQKYTWHMPCLQGEDESLKERPEMNVWEEALHQEHDESLEERYTVLEDVRRTDANSEKNAWHVALRQGQGEWLEERFVQVDESERLMAPKDALKPDTNVPTIVRGEGLSLEGHVPWLPKEVEQLRQKNTLLEYTQGQMASEIESLKLKINQLTDQLYSLQHKGISTDDCVSSDEWIVKDIFDEQLHTGPGQNIYMLGGNDGNKWLQTAKAINPVTYQVKPLATMLFPRSYAAATVLLGQIYIFGGGNGESWFKTAEYYDNEKNEWLACPSMGIKRGSLAGVTLRDRIYAIGGGNGQLNFSEVECYDFHLGMWIMSTSMLNKRFGVAAVELDGAIYAMGGYNDRRYLRSVERYDPREALWTSMAPLHHKRGSLSATVLNGKIYVIGGYDGANILNSVEIYESRKDCWIEMETGMHWNRSYASAVTVGRSIYVLGGYTGKHYLQTVERYQTDLGWDLVEHAVVGKCGFHAGVVL